MTTSATMLSSNWQKRFKIGKMKPVFFFLLLIPIYLNASDYQNANKPVWIDVRTSKEYKARHKKGAILIPFNEIGKRISELALPLDTEIYLYCRSGGRAQKALNTLNKIGYKAVVNVGSLENAMKVK